MRNLTRKIILFLFIIYPTTVFAEDFANGNKFDFRKTTWGMTQAQVKKSEEISIHDSSDKKLIYQTVISQKDANAEYNFSNGKLTQASYIVNEGYYDPARNYDDFIMFDKVLTKKYGKPTSAEKKGVGTESIRKSLSEPVAMSLGYLILTTTWDLKRSSIVHVVKKSVTNAGVEHSIIFTAK
jgi:hypothetical protein